MRREGEEKFKGRVKTEGKGIGGRRDKGKGCKGIKVKGRSKGREGRGRKGELRDRQDKYA